MKIIYTTLVITALAFTIFSCSKKIVLHTDQDQYKKYSQQLEMNYESDNSILSASINENEMVVPKADARFETTAPKVQSKTKTSALAGNRSIIHLNNVNKIEKNSPQYKTIIKKQEGPLKNQGKKEAQAVTGKLRTGIILAAVGLLLLVTAQFFGPASPVIYVAGAVLVIIGVVLILLDVL